MSIACQTAWKKNEISAALKNSRRIWQSAFLDIKIANNPTGLPGKLLIITPGKIGIAVKRNRFRRRVKSIFYQEKLYQFGFNWIIFGKSQGLDLCFQDLKKIMLNVACLLSKHL